MIHTVVTSENFASEVAAHDGTTLLTFWAPWCGACSVMEPVVRSIAEDFGELKIGMVNVDAEAELAEHFEVRSIPAFFLLRGDCVTGRAVGTYHKDQLLCELGMGVPV